MTMPTLETLWEREGRFEENTPNGDPIAYKDDNRALYCAECATDNRDIITGFDDAVFNEECYICDQAIGEEVDET